MEASGGNGIRVFLSAGEASGDLHGSLLVRALQRLDPDFRVTCLGGPLLEEAGAAILVDNRELALVGFVEGFRQVKLLYQGWQRIKRHLIDDRPNVVVLIDFPDFNFMVARLARRLGLKVLYYISPQVWAWRSGRVRTLRRLVDEMAVILPFEPAFYKNHHIQVHYVGHPLLDVMSSAPSHTEARRRYRPREIGPCVGLLPGSRHGEIRSLLPLLVRSAGILLREFPDISFLIPVAPTLDSRIIEDALTHADLPVRIVAGDTYGVIGACDLIITASGTVTLEAAILETPMIVVYKLSKFSYHVARHLVRVKYAALPNLIAGRRIVPELIQDEANERRVVQEAGALLRDSGRLGEQREALSDIRPLLGRSGVADRVAKLVVGLQGRRSTGIVGVD
jgi:lipid-A-disaccharide synthase